MNFILKEKKKNMPLKINAYVIAAKWQPKTKVVKSQKTVGDVGIFTAVIEVIKEQTNT